MRKVVSNTTPLIALADIGHLDLLQKLYGEILIPEAVLDEIKTEPAKTVVNNSSWIKVKKIKKNDEKSLFRAKLHAGEVEVMILADEMNADLLLMDDNAAKKTAKFLGMTVTGTLGILIRAKKEGYIPTVRPLLDALLADGLYISDAVRDYVLEAAGEGKKISAKDEEKQIK